MSGKRLRLLFLGNLEQPQKTFLQEEAQNLNLQKSVAVTGFLSREEIFKYLQVSDLFIIFDADRPPEGSGISLKSGSVAAAFAAGIPILSNRGSLTESLFQHRKNVF